MMKNRPIYIYSIFMVSAGTLAFEVVLTRIFALAYWHHFAGLLISLALTGFGTAGSLLALLLPRLKKHREVSLAATALAAGIAMPCAYLAALKIGLEPLALAWSKGAWLDLSLVCLILVVPFLLAAAHIGLALAWAESPGRLYAVNLAGSAAGCLAAAGLLSRLTPNQAVLPAAVLTFWGSAAYFRTWGTQARWACWILAGLGVVLAAAHPLPLHFEPFKDRSAVLAGRGNRLLYRSAGLQGVVEVIGGPAFHHAPGLSLGCLDPLPLQAGLFLDGDLSGPITYLDPEQKPPAFTRCLMARLPYQALDPEDVLIINPGGGLGIMAALDQRPRRILAVEDQVRIYELMGGAFKKESGDLYHRNGVRALGADPVVFIDRTPSRFDLIVLGDGTRWESGWSSGLGVTRLLTVEGVTGLLGRLTPKGVLVVSGPLMTPPRASIKLMATVIESLKRRPGPKPGPEACLVLARDWNTVMLMVGPNGFKQSQIDALRAQAAAKSFDFSVLPGLDPQDLNQFHQLPGEPLFRAAKWLLAHQTAPSYPDTYFDVRPAYRDRPYFFHFFKYKTLSLIMNPREGRPLGVMEWGVLFTWGALGAALMLAAAGILVPLVRLRPMPSGFWFFGLIGLGYMMAEIGLLHETIHSLGRPALAVPLVIGVFLLSSGAGSLLWGHRPPRLYALASAMVLPLSLLTIRYFPGRMWAVFLALAPPALVMGVPFAGGLTHMAGPDPRSRAWAFGWNGFFSVAGSLAAGLICLQAGHLAGILSAAACYLLAGIAVQQGGTS